MPRREDLESILIIGAGPIVIGQACEFDYSGVQACKALKEEGYRVILVNSNPATIMTDPELADRTYIEPLNRATLEAIIARERPTAVLPTVGGQTALNLAMQLAKEGVFDAYGVELIGANVEAIERAENREAFRSVMHSIGMETARSGVAHTLEEALEIAERIGFPIISRPSFTLGGTGGGVAFGPGEFEQLVLDGLHASPTSEILLEESLLGWKEYEYEVVRDTRDNVIIVCSIENLDPMGVHTGDSITVAPAQTLTDKESQVLRDASIAIIRAIGVDTGGSNIQFAIDPSTGRVIVIEMNPRVSRSSALASKATGFPIAKVAARLAVGYTLDELVNDITGTTSCCFEPSIDYVVTKIPRFTFEKFPKTPPVLTTAMRSIGEAMSIGRTFKESLQKGLRSLETGLSGFDPQGLPDETLEERLTIPNPDRILSVADAYRAGLSTEQIYAWSRIDPWFLEHIAGIVNMESEIAARGDIEALDAADLWSCKQAGFSDRRIATLLGTDAKRVRAWRRQHGVRPAYKRVDTCAAEFEAQTGFFYSTYERECESRPTDRKKVIILGGGPNRIGQGIEFDYCCCHASFALRDAGYETIMVNCNPETVSTDYDTSDRLYLEPVTLEDVLEIVDLEQPMGVILQFGGQTPLRLAVALEEAGVPILGTKSDAIDLAEDRSRFNALLETLKIRQPQGGLARTPSEAVTLANALGYPVLVRPSYVLGGRAMEIVHDEDTLARWMRTAVKVSPEHPVLVDAFLGDAIEVDVDAVSDGRQVVVGGILEHVEEAGVHSGDSASVLPPYSLPPHVLREIRVSTHKLAQALHTVGLINVQFAVKGDDVFVLEVNPRASRTVPFVSKAIGQPLAKIAARVMAGETLVEVGFVSEVVPRHVSVKEVVLPFKRFPGNDVILGPEMRSTGEVMGIAENWAAAFAKAFLATSLDLPMSGAVFVSVADQHKHAIVEPTKVLRALGFRVLATDGTARYLRANGVPAERIPKLYERTPGSIVERMRRGAVQLVVNTTGPKETIIDSRPIRETALYSDIPYVTTARSYRAVVAAIARVRREPLGVRSLQEHYTAATTAEEPLGQA